MPMVFGVLNFQQIIWFEDNCGKFETSSKMQHSKCLKIRISNVIVSILLKQEAKITTRAEYVFYIQTAYAYKPKIKQ